MTSKKRDLVKMEPVLPVASPPLLEDLRRIIEETRQGVAATVNAALTLTLRIAFARARFGGEIEMGE